MDANREAVPTNDAARAQDALKHLGEVLSFLSDLHPDDRCTALDDALAFHNAARPDCQVTPSGVPGLQRLINEPLFSGAPKIESFEQIYEESKPALEAYNQGRLEALEELAFEFEKMARDEVADAGGDTDRARAFRDAVTWTRFRAWEPFGGKKPK